MNDPFVHLHAASGYSLPYGASSPAALVERAVGTTGVPDQPVPDRTIWHAPPGSAGR